MSKLIYFITTILIADSETARILAFFPIPSISHQIVFRPLIQELVKQGHEVVVATTDPAFAKGKAPPNMTEIDLHDISYEFWRKSFMSTNITQGNTEDWINQAKVIFDVLIKVFEKQMMDEEVVRAVYDKSKKFDLLIVEACMFATLGLTHVHKVPLIQVSSFGSNLFDLQAVGAPIHIFRQPISSQQRITELSFFDKIHVLYMYVSMKQVFDNYERNADIALKRIFGPDIPDLSVLRNNVDMVFLNVHSLWEINRPVPPNVIYMGSVHQNLPKELPEALKTYLDSSKNGVIYVSFGTNVDPSLLPSERIQMLIKIFSKLPYDILWKWNQDELPGRSANIKISKWLPQSDLLRHPKIRLFITQGGLQSTDEAITAGVPLIGIPMLGDQWYNVELYVYHKIGIRLDLPKIDEEIFLSAINTVITDESYRNNVAKLRAIMQDQSQTPLERAVWWVEYVLRHGGARHLRSPLANISWTEYFELEFVLFLAIVLISATLSSVLLLYWVCKLIFRFFDKKLKIKTK